MPEKYLKLFYSACLVLGTVGILLNSPVIVMLVFMLAILSVIWMV